MLNLSSLSIAQQIDDISEKYEFYSNILLTITGLISNFLIILILTRLRIFYGNQCAFYLIIECLSNLGLLVVMFFSRISTHIIGIDLIHLSIIWCKIRSWITQVFALISLYTICFATFDQYLSTHSRYFLRQMSTLNLAHHLTIFNISFAILHNIPLLFLAEIRSSNGCAVYNTILKKYFSFFYYTVITGCLPVIVTSSYSLLAYRNVRRIIRRQVPLVHRRLDRQLTAMILTRVISLLTLGLPYIIYSLCTLNISIRENNFIGLAIKRLIGIIIFSLFYANFSINFYLFLFISSRFRHQVKHYLIKKHFQRRRSHQVVPKNDYPTICVIE